MPSLDTLPADQRAVLQLLLQRGRSYDQIAQLLSIDRDAVRERAVSALDGLGPETRVPSERKALITDYLLGQLPPQAAQKTRTRLAESPSERAWARVVASELAPLATGPLPEIPVEEITHQPPEPETAPDAEPESAPNAAVPEERPSAPDAAPPEPEPEPTIAGEPIAAGAPAQAATSTTRAGSQAPGAEPPGERRSSRTGGAILLAAGALVAIAVVAAVVLLVVNSGGGKSHRSATAAATAKTSTGASASATTSAAPAARPIAQVNLVSPTRNKKIAGVAEVLKQGSKTGLVLVAQGMPANSSHDAYAVWLYNSPSDNRIVGFVNPGVKTDGKLQTAGLLPANAAHFKRLLVTLETQAKPHGPGKIVLQGALSISQ
jgi:Sigma-70, region 4